MVCLLEPEQRMSKSPQTPMAKLAENVQQINDALGAIYSILEVDAYLKETVSFTVSAKERIHHGKPFCPHGTGTADITFSGNHNNGSTVTHRAAKARLRGDPSVIAPSENDSLRRGQRRTPRWQKVFDFVGPDSETLAVLRQNQEVWTLQPQLFVGLTSSPPQANCHPLLIVACSCMQLEFEQAWAKMLRRAWCVIYSRLEKRFHTPIARLAEIILTTLPYTKSDFERKLAHYSTAGSRYECWINDFGEGVIFYLGRGIEEFMYVRSVSIKELKPN